MELTYYASNYRGRDRISLMTQDPVNHQVDFKPFYRNRWPVETTQKPWWEERSGHFINRVIKEIQAIADARASQS
jgi:hypothetical protein